MQYSETCWGKGDIAEYYLSPTSNKEPIDRFQVPAPACSHESSANIPLSIYYDLE